MVKIQVQAQHLKPGDIVGSGEVVAGVVIASIKWPSSKVCVVLENGRTAYWGKRTMINVERKCLNN